MKIQSITPTFIKHKGWLTERFGECVAQLSTDTTLKLRSSIKDVFRVLHGVSGAQAISSLTNELPMPPQGITDAEFVFGYKGSDGSWTPGIIETDLVLQGFVAQYPHEWSIVQKLLGLTRSKSRHACAFVIADEPISNFIPITTVGGVRVTQYTASTVESSGGLKMDFLIVNSLKDIGACIRLIQDRHAPEHTAMWAKARGGLTKEEAVPGMRLNGKFVPAIRCVPRNGQFYDIWDLPEDQPVFRDICESKTESVFQFNTPGAKLLLRNFNAVRATIDGEVHKGLDSIEALAAFTALDRPGPLDYFMDDGNGGQHNMLVEFARRARGLPDSGDSLPVLRELLPETYGVIVYQEQLTKIYQQLGGTTGAEADEFRVHISKKQMAKVIKDKEVFVRGAYPRLGEETSEKLWAMMETFARYGFNKSHAVCYVVIGYACAYLKHHYPLEWWTSVLKNADRNEINEKFWVHCGKFIDVPDIKLSGPHFEIQGERIRAPLWLLKGIGDKAQEQITANGPYENVVDFTQKIEDWRLKNATTVTRKKKDKKTGEEIEVQSQRLATTALNSRVITTLIVSGAMDSLFDYVAIGTELFPMTTGQKLAAYEAAQLAASGKKKKKKKDVELRTIDPLVQYQMRKQILPALSEPLVALVKPLVKDKFVKIEGRDFIHHKPTGNRQSYNDYPLATPDIAEQAANSDISTEIVFAVVGYVNSDRRFRYGNKSAAEGEPKTKTASELTVDIEGVTIKAVKWPLDGGLPPPFQNDLTGAVAVLLYRKRPNKGVTVDDVLVVQPSLDQKLEEASPEPLEESP